MPSAQNLSYAKMAYFGVACPDNPQHQRVFLEKKKLRDLVNRTFLEKKNGCLQNDLTFFILRRFLSYLV